MSPGESCALFIIDLDNFKQVNDVLGHQAGDHAIRQSAQILSSIFRASDVVGRLGGDEFVAFLCGNLTEDLVYRKASLICGNLQMVLGDRETVQLTASVGVHLSTKGQTFEGLYQAADLALYKAKKSGKNRFCLKNGESYPQSTGREFRPVNSISLGNLLENIDSGLALVELGKTLSIIYVSPSFCRIIGADFKNYPLPQALSDLVHPDDLISLARTLREGGCSGKTVEHTHRVRARVGDRWIWWHMRGMQIEYDNPNPVILITTTDISQFVDNQQALEEVNQRFRAAFDQTFKLLWEVDIAARTFSVFEGDGETRSPGYDRKGFPDYLVDSGWVHPNSVPRFRTFARDLLDGQAQGYGNFIIQQRGNSSYGWATLSFRMLFDEVGRAVRAVGVLEDLPQGFVGRSGSFAQLPMPEGLVSDLIAYMQANLEMDTVESLWMEGTDMSSQMQKSCCTKVLQLEKEKIWGRGDATSALGNFDREHLLQMYQRGRRRFTAEYQRADSGGSIQWVRCMLCLEEDPASHQVCLLLYLVRLDPHHMLARAIRGNVKRDSVSRLYNQESIQQIADALFAERSSGNRAVAVLQVNGFAKHHSAGGLSVEQMRYEIAATLSLVLGGNCVLGQYSINQIVVVFPTVTMKDELRRQIEEAVAFLRRMLFPERAYRTLRFVTGIALLSASAADYSQMLIQAIHTCLLWLDAVTDTVAFAQEADGWGWLQMLPSKKEDHVAVHSTEMLRPLSEREKDVAFDCVSTMLTARTLDASLIGTLQTIGAYYHADRVYTLSLVENQRAVVMNFEWTSQSKCSIQQVVSGMQLNHFPLLERCLEERAPVFLTRKEAPAAKFKAVNGDPWYYTAFPLIRNQEVTGFLCIENAREHSADAALFGTLIPYMLLERERFHGEEHAVGTVQHLMGLPDRKAYLTAAQTFTSEHFSSLGAICLDIPGLSAANNGYGFEYGNQLLWYVAKTLTDLFRPSLLFRIKDAEFVIFFPNTTREVFLGRCGRLRSILQRRYPRHVRVGRAWSDGMFTGKGLVKRAKAAMEMEFDGSVAGIQNLSASSNPPPSQDSKLSDSLFTVYFQPKIDMRTGGLAGAEALVRGIGEDGSIISPSQFIDIMEADGIIRDLDFLVLERTLAQTAQWQADGLGTVPVSVNLSRVTIAHPSTLASVLAVQSRYPDIPADALELEITERWEDVDNTELKKIVEQFHACGLRLSLDDFGSQYANLPLFTSIRFDTVKLDRSLVTDIVCNPINRTLVEDIIRICQTYGMSCVAEGIETEGQITALLEMGCTCAQGFYYDRPLPAEEFERKYLRGRGSAVRGCKHEEERT